MAARNQTQTQGTARTVWWSLVGGIVVWSLHLMIVYPLTSLACERGLFTGTVAGILELNLIQIITTVIAALIVAGLGLLALRAWRRTQVPAGGVQTAKGGSHHLIAFVAMLLNGMFLISILLAFVPIVVLQACG